MSNIENALREDGAAIAKTEGDSMEPMLYNGTTVIITTPTFPLKEGDVPVYHRDDHLTMHRIIRVTDNGYVISGDNRKNLETDITDTDIIGVLSGFYKDGKYVDINDSKYLKYSKKMCRRYNKKALRLKIKAFFRKLLKG